MEKIPTRKEIQELKNSFINKDRIPNCVSYEPKRVSEELFNFLKRNEAVRQGILPPGKWVLSFYKGNIVHLNRRICDDMDSEFKYLKDNGVIKEYRFKSSILQSLIHLKKASSHTNPKTLIKKNFDIEKDPYSRYSDLVSPEHFKVCANIAVFCNFTDYKNMAELYGLNWYDIREIIADIRENINPWFTLNVYNFESDRNEFIREALNRKKSKCHIYKDSFYTDFYKDLTLEIMQEAHNAAVMNYWKYKTEDSYFHYEKDKD